MKRSITTLLCGCALASLLSPATLWAQPGSIVAWGRDWEDQLNVPPPNTAFVAIATVAHHSLGLRADGSIEAWGENGDGQLSVPLPNEDFVAIDAGGPHSLGLKANGSVVVWGSNADGQLDVPLPNENFVAIAGGEFHIVGLKADGSVVAWGLNSHGQLDVPVPNADFVAIAAGAYHSLGLKTDGSIVAWGRNENGQITVPTPNSEFAAIDAGAHHSLGLKADASIVAWGAGGPGQSGHRNFGQSIVPSANTDFVALSGGRWHSLGLKADGSIVAWGWNSNGQVDLPDPNADFIAIAGGGGHNLALKRENQDPIAICGANMTVEADGASGTVVQLDGSASYDPDDDPVFYHWDAPVTFDDPDSPTPIGAFPIGITTATLTVTDGRGGVSTCDTLVTVVDNTPPEVFCTSDVAMLWPPNHEMRSVRLIVTGTDGVSDSQDITVLSLTISSNEPDDADGSGDGETAGDVDGQDGFAAPVELGGQLVFDPSAASNGAWVAIVNLRAERAGDGDGRCYTVEVLARDTAGNVATTSCCIVVPHDRRRR